MRVVVGNGALVEVGVFVLVAIVGRLRVEVAVTVGDLVIVAEGV